MGRTSILAFLKEYKQRALEELDFARIDDDYDHLPDSPGGYVIRATGRLTWTYPWGSSPVYYIGKANDLRERLWNHWDIARSVRNHDFPEYFYPVHNFEAAFPSSYYPIPTWQRMTPDALEEELLARFIRTYGARPVANGQIRWKRV